MLDLGALEARLRRAGLRVTQPRLGVLLVLERARSDQAHLSVAETVERTREIVAGLSPQTVYRCLDALVSAGLARRVDLPGAPARFETGGDHHDHLVCDRCGSITNVARTEPAGERLEVAERHRFQVLQTEVVFHGLCAACSTA
ncbi:Fur family transcriptional regulator [Nocardioides sp. MH1]|uniref:Fur family transcriptional regulator n=1 Tax=Nocardioides sp. MH1 TaxID=3242490 RepID=UPI003521E152